MRYVGHARNEIRWFFQSSASRITSLACVSQGARHVVRLYDDIRMYVLRRWSKRKHTYACVVKSWLQARRYGWMDELIDGYEWHKWYKLVSTSFLLSHLWLTASEWYIMFLVDVSCGGKKRLRHRRLIVQEEESSGPTVYLTTYMTK